MRKTTVAAAIAAAALLGALDGTAGAVPGHRSCKDLGGLIAWEARTGIIPDEMRSYDPGTVDDIVALVQVGGTYGDEEVPAFCAGA